MPGAPEIARDPALSRQLLQRARALGLIDQPPADDAAAQLAGLLSGGTLSPQTLEELERLIRAEPPTLESSEASAAKPPAAGDRYRLVAQLGEGASGQVFKAWDEKLGRNVALKLLRRDDPRALERFLRESRAQARVEHPNVCRVFDASEHEGRPCIAMELVEGPTLAEAARSLSLEEKVCALRDVADAVQAAHATGLLHRDLKPGNVLVRSGGHGLQPVVVDFGLAQDLSQAGASITGQIAGTPQFMSPEQARGEKSIDRRSDVWGLGATLFAVLAGRPPFEGAVAEVLLKVLHDDAPRLRTLLPSLPRDLETVVGKCLEKDPARRYESARALADDLRRFLDGRPVLARRKSLAYSALKAVQRQRVLSLVVVLALAALGAVWLVGRARSAERAALSQRFGQQAERMQQAMRRAYALPLHDIRRERALVQERIAGIEREMAAHGELVRAAGELALGRGQLALEDYAAARVHFERALAAGIPEAELGGELGLALARLYRRELAAARALPSPKARERRKQELETSLRAPALAHLRGPGGSQLESRSYVEGQIALLERRPEEAIALGDKAFGETPWLYEARQLTAEARMVQAGLLRQAGAPEKLAAARAAAGADFAAALQIARSDPALLALECDRRFLVAGDLTFTRKPADAAVADARAGCAAATAADPDDLRPLMTLAQLSLAVVDDLLRGGKDPVPELQKIFDLLAPVLRSRPDDPSALTWRGSALVKWAWWEANRSLDARKRYEDAVADFRRAAALDPADLFTQYALGSTLTELGNQQATLGLEARPALEEAAQCLERARQDRMLASTADTALAWLLRLRTAYEHGHGGDWRAPLAAGLEVARRVAGKQPDGIDPWIDLAGLFKLKAEYEHGEGGDAAAGLRSAEEAFAKARAINSKEVRLEEEESEELLFAAEVEEDAGRDPRPLLVRAAASAERALAQRPGFRTTLLAVGRARLNLARVRAARGEDGRADLARAAAAFELALRDKPDDPELQLARCTVLVAGRSLGAAETERCDQVAQRALALAPSAPEPAIARAQILVATLHVERDPSRRAERARAAHDALAAARKLKIKSRLLAALATELEAAR